MRKFLLGLVLLLSACGQKGHHQETAMERILRTGVIRCGYYVFPPITYRDPNTNALSGFSVDMMNKIAKVANLKVEWSEEVNFANWTSGLEAKRYDAACTPMWPDIPLTRVVAFSIPMMYAGLSPLVRADDARFKGDDLARFDQPDVRFLTQDGNALDSVTRETFPHATIIAMPASMDGPTVMQEIVTKKADAILLDRNAEIAYNKNNPVKLRLVATSRPVKSQEFTLAVDRREAELKYFLDNAIGQMLNDGSIDRLLEKWENEPGQFLRVAKPYEAKK